MDEELSNRIATLPVYQRLRARRTRFGWTLTALMLLVHYGFVLLVAFDKPLLAQRLGDGVMMLGIPAGFGVIVFTVPITAFYVQRANAEFDTLSDAIRKATAK